MTAMLAITVLGRCCEANESMRHEVEGHPAFREIYLAITSSLSEYSARHTSQIMWAVSRFQLPEPFPMPSFAYHTIPKLPELSTSEMVAMLQG